MAKAVAASSVAIAAVVIAGCATAPGQAPAAAAPAADTTIVVEAPPPRPPPPAPELPSPSPLERRARTWHPLGVRWSPAVPEEGTPVGIHLLQPAAGRRAVTVEGALAGGPVRFARLGDGWFGIGAVPIGTSGPLRLDLRITVEGDSAVEQSVTLEALPREFPSTTLRVDPRFSAPPPAALARIERERIRVRETLARVTPAWLLEGPFLPPRPGSVTSPFGQRRVFNGELRSRHLGTDLRGSPGDPVRAAARGRVALADDLYYAGRAVYLDHGLGVYTSYFHLSRIRVAEGEMVEAGQVIGEVGATGRVTGPHLHWSLYVAGESLDASRLLGLEVPAGGGG